MSYEEIYKMKPLYEDLKRGGKGWWKLKWKPIWFGTIYIYNSWTFSKLGKVWWQKQPAYLGLDIHTGYGAMNGWNRSYDRVDISIGLIITTIRFWIKYNYIVHKDGPSDVGRENFKPLVFDTPDQKEGESL